MGEERREGVVSFGGLDRVSRRVWRRRRVVGAVVVGSSRVDHGKVFSVCGEGRERARENDSSSPQSTVGRVGMRE